MKRNCLRAKGKYSCMIHMPDGNMLYSCQSSVCMVDLKERLKPCVMIEDSCHFAELLPSGSVLVASFDTLYIITLVSGTWTLESPIDIYKLLRVDKMQEIGHVAIVPHCGANANQIL